MTSVPYTFKDTRSTASLHDEFGQVIEAGTHVDAKVRVAGRLMLRRGQGKLAFGQLADATGRIQLFAPSDVTEDFEVFTQLSLGDWIGVDGTMMKTRKGELSVQVTKWTKLAEARRQFPDKWHGLTDTDLRYRQRYVDLWVNDDARRTLLVRSKAVRLIRSWLEERGFLEVETPMLHPIPGGTNAKPFSTHYNTLDMELFLRIAPELYLKRLVVGGFERIFEVGRNFRNEGLSPRHLSEFTMLELYQAYGDYHDMMAIVEQLVAHLASELLGATKFEYQGRELDVSVPWPRRTMADLVSESIGTRVSVDTPMVEMTALAEKYLGHFEPGWGAGKILMELYEKTTESNLWDPVFVTDLPKEVSPLSRDHRSAENLVEHADAVLAGRELAPCYSELIDPDEQRSRFEDQLKKRNSGDDEAMVIDADFLRALEYGMPPTGGLGLGIDRLVMILTDVATVRDVVLFPTLRPEVSGGGD